MQLQYFTLSKKQFNDIPEDDRALIVLMGHAANELNILGKLLCFCKNQEETTSLLNEAQNAQALTLVRILAGKACECWKLLSKKLINKKSNIYEQRFDEETKKSLDSLKEYFKGGNTIKLVRDKFGFHYSPNKIPAGYKKIEKGDKLDFCLSRVNGNTLHVFAETIVNRSLLESINPNDHHRALGALIDETNEVIKWFIDVTNACLAICLIIYVGEDLEELGAHEIEVENAPNLKDVTIPYFVEIAESIPSNCTE